LTRGEAKQRRGAKMCGTKRSATEAGLAEGGVRKEAKQYGECNKCYVAFAGDKYGEDWWECEECDEYLCGGCVDPRNEGLCRGCAETEEPKEKAGACRNCGGRGEARCGRCGEWACEECGNRDDGVQEYCLWCKEKGEYDTCEGAEHEAEWNTFCTAFVVPEVWREGGGKAVVRLCHDCKTGCDECGKARVVRGCVGCGKKVCVVCVGTRGVVKAVKCKECVARK